MIQAGFSAILAFTLAAGAFAAPAAARDKPARAKNVILFIGDGMGISTITATRIFDGQSRGESGEDNVLPFEKFDDIALVKTYNVNSQVPDSAGTASAMLTGVKTRMGMIGIGPDTHRGDCMASKARQVATIGELAVQRGLGVGIVTTTRLTHATPAAVYAHVADRGWEADSLMPKSAYTAGCDDIGRQFSGFPFAVALGGGSGMLRSKDLGGLRLGAKTDLINEWQDRTGGTLATTRTQLASAPKERPLLGLFASGHLGFAADRKPDSTEPALAEMTTAAIRHLSGRKQGYFLMVEGGLIDQAHHDGRAGYALREAQEFSRAVETAIAQTDPAETLILVTADHSHVFVMSGYPKRGNPILGLVVGTDERGEALHEPNLAADGLPYTTLGYWNGPGAINGKRTMPQTGIAARQQAAIPTHEAINTNDDVRESHGGEDVALFGRGPGAERVKGVIEQNRIFDIITSAFGWNIKADAGER